jgi:HlyD family secretion protein
MQVISRQPGASNLNIEDHGPEGIAILTSEPSRLSLGLIASILALLLAALAWSFFGRADVVVKAPGTLQPEARLHRLFSPHDGEVVDVFMTEGMPVAKGDVLLRVNSINAIDIASRAYQSELKYEDAKRRLAAFPDKRALLENKLEALRLQLKSEEASYRKRMKETLAKLAEAQRVKLEKARAKLDKAEKARLSAKETWAKYLRLYQSPGQGGVSGTEVEEKKREYESKQADYRLANAELAEFEVKLSEEFLKNREEIQKKQENVMNLRNQRDELELKLIEDEARLVSEVKLARVSAESSRRMSVSFEDIDEDNFVLIRAPVSGVVTETDVAHPGDKLNAKKSFASIAPLDSDRILKIEIPEKNRGFIREGMPVKVKFNSFPYQRYGFISGTLEYIAPATTLNQARQSVYIGHVKLDRDYYQSGGEHYPLRYGMSATAEIMVRKRRVIDFALDQIRNIPG